MAQTLTEAVEEAKSVVASLESQRTGLEARLQEIDRQLAQPTSDDVDADIARLRDLTGERDGVVLTLAGFKPKIAAATTRLGKLEDEYRAEEYSRLCNLLREEIAPIVEGLDELIAMSIPLADRGEEILDNDWRTRGSTGRDFYRVEAAYQIRFFLENTKNTICELVERIPNR